MLTFCRYSDYSNNLIKKKCCIDRFWKNCSLAYANQCIEQGLVLQAIPHLLATQQTNEAIEKLYDAHFYREAWCIAKMFKESEDKIFETIVTKWIAHLEYLGNLEGAALMYVLIVKHIN